MMFISLNLTNIYNSKVFWWIIGIIVGQIYNILICHKFNINAYQSIILWLFNLVILCLGAKLLYIIENFDYVIHSGIGFSGFSLFGAIFIQLVSNKLLALVFKKNYFEIASTIIVPFIIMLGFYRIDCLRNGCCGGIMIGSYHFPTQIIEIVFSFLLAIIFTYLIYLKNVSASKLFCSYYIAYGTMRFILEFFRIRENIFGPFSISHVWAIILVLIGIIMLVKRRGKNEKNN